jgi:hypothetical protein
MDDDLGVAEGTEVRRLRNRQAAFAWWRDPGGLIRTLKLEDRERDVLIGRAPRNDVIFASASVSMVHARLISARGEWFYEDQSRNGSEIAEAVHRQAPEWQPLRGGRRRLWFAHNVIRLARNTGSVLHVELPSAGVITAGVQGDRVLDSLDRIYVETLLALCQRMLADPRERTLTNGEIAEALLISVDTVKDRLSKLYERYEIPTRPPRDARVKLATRALDEGLRTLG